LVLNNLQPASWEASFDCLTGLAGLQQLQLGFNMPGNYFLANAAPLPPGLTAVTQLSITGVTTDDVFGPTLSTMTQLRSLRLSQPEDFQEELLDCSWVTALKELRHLDLSSCWLWELPEDLGEALPALEVLLVAGCRMQEPLPPGMTRLTQLDASKNPGLRSAGLDTVCEATALRRLNLSGSHDMDTACLSALSQLEVLELRDCGPRPKDAEEQEGRHSSGSERDSVWQPPTLPHLVNLRHLDLGKGDWWVSDLVPMGGLQQLMYLNLSHGLGAHHHRKDAVSLPSLGVLPALQRLDLSHVSIKGNHWPPVGAWLGQQPQLTQLFLQHSGKLRRRRRGGREPAWGDVMYQTQGLAQLPTQLVELNLRHCSLQDLPACLSRLTNLQVLLAGAGNSYTTRALPAWVTLLQQLEVLEVEKVDPPMGEAAAALLARLPRLREFRLDDIWCVDDHKYLFRRLPHLSGLS
jgi:Leucine-rich repeat (LRR) protein